VAYAISMTNDALVESVRQLKENIQTIDRENETLEREKKIKGLFSNSLRTNNSAHFLLISSHLSLLHLTEAFVEEEKRSFDSKCSRK
jgi:formate dehydrogenase maturation protein FdhE